MWWLPAASLLMLGAALYVISALHVLTFSPLIAGREGIDREGAAGTVLSRQSVPVAATEDSAVPTVRLRAGEHPNAVDFDVPVPRDARPPGPRMRAGEDVPPSPDRVLLVTAGDVSEVIAFYRDELAARGWHEVRTWMSRPTDGVPGSGGAISAFCRGVDMPAILVGVISRQVGPSELRLLIDAEQPGPCASAGERDQRKESPPPIF